MRNLVKSLPALASQPGWLDECSPDTRETCYLGNTTETRVAPQ